MAGVEEFNPNKVAAELLQNLIKDTSKLLTAPVRDFFRQIADVLQKDFKPYVESTIKRCSSVKTLIINREGPSNLFDIYVHTRLKVKGKEIEDDDFIRDLAGLRSVVIEGNGGSGKSMLMRYLFISLCNNFFGKLPLFIELRTLNTFSTKNLIAFMHHSITTAPGTTLSRDQFNNGLKAGSFCIILDGFDEVDVDQRANIEKQILELREKFPELIIIVSSRPDPDNRFQSWIKFNVCRVQPMNREQVNELIDKLDYDSQIKRKFLKELDTFFRTHKSFLSNPLLCIMMLITFEQYGHIPDKMHIFYEHAFDALFFRHDAAKEGVYRRKTYGNLSIDAFRDCLSSFCLASYSKERFSFTTTEVKETIKIALALERKEVAPGDYLNDLLESVCILQMEGLQYQFTHRSFQEYFAAFFLARAPAKLRALLDQFSRRRQDEVVPMAFAMNRTLIEREWIIPKLKEYAALANSINPRATPIEYANKIFGGLSLQHRGRTGGEFIYRNISPLGTALLMVHRLYGEIYAPIERSLGKDNTIIKKALDAMANDGDNRITTMGSNRVRSGEILLTENDAWLRKTRVPIYFDAHKAVTLKLLAELELAAVEQQTTINDLL